MLASDATGRCNPSPVITIFRLLHGSHAVPFLCIIFDERKLKNDISIVTGWEASDLACDKRVPLDQAGYFYLVADKVLLPFLTGAISCSKSSKSIMSAEDGFRLTSSVWPSWKSSFSLGGIGPELSPW
jgi:hypothetical protein